MERKDGTIDLGALLALALREKKRVAAIMASCLVIAIVLAFILPKQYESTVLVRAKAPGQNGLSAAAGAMAALGLGGNVSTPTMAYIELMKSRSVLEPVIEALDLEPEVKEKLTAEKFAKSNLKLQNAKGTDLIEIAATGRSPEEAQQIATGVYEGFQNLMTRLNRNDQSQLVSFLNDRIVLAKKEAEVATEALETFRQKEKVYVPDEQAKALLEKKIIYDKLANEAQINEETAKVKLQETNKQLFAQNAALTEFHMADNPGVQKIRDTMIEKQIALVDLGQKYTEKHPEVINLKEQIVALNAQLAQEIQDSVQAGTNTLNPIHVGLLQEKVLTEIAIMVSKKQLAEVENIRRASEKEMSDLSAASLQYVDLSSKVQMTAEVYAMLVKNCEQAKIQEAMNSMDLQLVDAADLPNEPSAPRKALVAAIGLFIGTLLSGCYVLFLYSRVSAKRN